MKLIIANKTYSSWSMRPWVVLKHFGIPFEEVWVKYDSMKPSDVFKTTTTKYAPTGKVPILVLEEETFSIWDSLSICEYLAERFPEKKLWPTDVKRRARARSVCAEMHSGFVDLRENLGFNVDAKFPEIGKRLLKDNENVRKQVDRMVDLFQDALSESGGPYLFGEFSIGKVLS
jgi:glutathione S-transferase